MNTSIIIPLAANGFGSRRNDIELRYCLRSIEKHLSGYGDIFIIGHKPKWVKGCIHIPATDDDKTWWKERNIYRKIIKACKDPRVTEDFLFMNDDHFLLGDFEAGHFPFYYFGGLAGQLGRDDQYGNTINNTFAEIGGDATFFDIHCPIVYTKEFFQWLIPAAWEKKYGYCIKTLYCALPWQSLHRMTTQQDYPDLKIRAPLSSSQIKDLIKDRLFFSIDNKAFEGSIEAVLQELYPNKSRYET